jgi:hypothetical protein
MKRIAGFALVLAVSLAVLPNGAAAQDPAPWRPPSAQMPQMPTMASLQGDWRAELGGWLRGVDAVSGVDVSGLRATGSARPGASRAQLLRLMNGPVPVVVWTDRNGDGRADMIELYRGGSVTVQLIDADYNGRGNVIRVYDASGALLREDRL